MALGCRVGDTAAVFLERGAYRRHHAMHDGLDLSYFNEYNNRLRLIEMKFYNAAHLVMVFYVPLIFVIVCYAQILHDIYHTLNQREDISDGNGIHNEATMTRVTSLRQHHNRRPGSGRRKQSFVSITMRPMRGQERLQKAKIRSLRITLLLIITYVLTWLPYNFLSWWSILSMDSYRNLEDVLYFLNCLVVLNSVINPFIYGRWWTVVAFGKCSDEIEQKRKSIMLRCRFVRNAGR